MGRPQLTSTPSPLPLTPCTPPSASLTGCSHSRWDLKDVDATFLCIFNPTRDCDPPGEASPRYLHPPGWLTEEGQHPHPGL